MGSVSVFGFFEVCNLMECVCCTSFSRVYFVGSEFGSSLDVLARDKDARAVKVTPHWALVTVQCLLPAFTYRFQG